MRWINCVLILFAIGCGPGPRRSDDTSGPCDSNGAHRCNGTGYEKCIGGEWTLESDCPLGCAEGRGCVDACTEAATNKSYMACEFWAVDLDNAVEVLGAASAGGCGIYGQGVVTMQKVCSFGTTGTGGALAGLCDLPDDHCPDNYTCGQRSVCTLDAQHSPFAIVVSNPQTAPVEVIVTGANNQTITQTIPPGEVKAILPQQGGIPDQSLDGSGKTRSAYKITSNLPIIAYQFNPLDNVNVFSNDASLLIPRTAFDVEYYAVTWPTLGRRDVPVLSQHDYNGYLTIVSWSDGTKVEVTPSAIVRAGPNQPELPAGMPATFTLNAFEVLNLEAKGADADLTGTKIHSLDVTTFGVFVGHEAAGFGEAAPPDSKNTRGPCCADHLEEMAVPASTWGKSYTIARSKQRTNENDVLRIVSRRPGTTVTFAPAPTSGDCSSLDAGASCTVKIMQDTTIEASEPVLVAHLIESSIWNGGGNGVPPSTVGNGDPSMSIAVATEQYRTDYTILVPNAYQQNFLSIATGPTGDVTVDGAPVTLEPAASGVFRAARMPVPAGQHTIKCPAYCGVEVYGYSDAVSYMFAGGLDLRPIVF